MFAFRAHYLTIKLKRDERQTVPLSIVGDSVKKKLNAGTRYRMITMRKKRVRVASIAIGALAIVSLYLAFILR